MNNDLLRLSVDGNLNVGIHISPWIWILAIAIAILVFLIRNFWHRLEIVRVNVDLGGVGQVELRPNLDDVQIAHRIWVELVTRKAALPIDPERDVIIEIYDSWYALFGKVRKLLGDVPSQLIRKEKSTRKLIGIFTETLNRGLRPHLTEWHARFRSWYSQHSNELNEKTPQQLQKEFPEYERLISDIKIVNQQLVQYASELQKVIYGEK